MGFYPWFSPKTIPENRQFLDEFLCLVTLTFCGHLPKRSNKLPAFVLSWYVHKKMFFLLKTPCENT
jgi:hypothetical protein